MQCNVTTVCTYNSSRSNYTCTCEDQYVWPSESCTTYGTCAGFANQPCQCIHSLPPQERLCQRGVIPATPTNASVHTSTTPGPKTPDLNNTTKNNINAIDTVDTIDTVRPGSILVDFTLTPNGAFDYVTFRQRLTPLGSLEQSDFDCSDTEYGVGNVNERKTINCTGDFVGTMTAECSSSGKWIVIKDRCILRVFVDLLERSRNLPAENITGFVTELNNETETNRANVTESPFTVVTIVEILNNVANASIQQDFRANENVMQDFLSTVDVITSDEAQETWDGLNTDNETDSTSSSLLQSLEDIGDTLSNTPFNVTTTSSELSRIFNVMTFNSVLGVNDTTEVDIPDINITDFTIMVFSSMQNALSARTATNINDSVITSTVNGDVVLVKLNNTVNNISFTFDIRNESLGNPQCVFWNFELLDGIGGWDSTGCELKPDPNETGKVTCECNHTTSFSILMSPFPSIPALSYITFIGVGISMLSLVLCLIIEVIVWKPLTQNDTSYMRHVSLVNIAVSLLIADIWFIIGAAIAGAGKETPVGPCSAATFFIHFFYLALFFWMLLSALFLLYRTVMVFSQMSRCTMMSIGFSVGYGAPLLIAVITVAVTAPGGGYIRERDACWLNWDKTKALLAFVIPALTIVAINFIIMIAVLYKMLRRSGPTTQPDERNAMVVAARCVAFLTPIFGLTWGFGIGTMVSRDVGVHVVFAVLNSLQGFFIFLFGTLLDGKV
ncbi:adhesion G-protein coupled receptor F1-like [Chanos chanos]|uniref:Adhesion G-protein coupled receptor F1-like n=1 Tax=Chanos chanos TaxID=29144 RepID=A0A6J2W7G3_CHACN|nr:adhesion G-protein coupled receptor F1-like [Chanos chanos]